MKIAVLLWFAVTVIAQAQAQSEGVKSISPAKIAALEQTLHTQAAASSGTASSILARYPGFYSSLIVRDKSGEAEIHRRFDEVMIVIDGKAEILTGGTARNIRTINPNELRGDAIQGGTHANLVPNTVMHIPADTPHQVFVPPGGSIAYIDIKVAHTKQ